LNSLQSTDLALELAKRERPPGRPPRLLQSLDAAPITDTRHAPPGLAPFQNHLLSAVLSGSPEEPVRNPKRLKIKAGDGRLRLDSSAWRHEEESLSELNSPGIASKSEQGGGSPLKVKMSRYQGLEEDDFVDRPFQQSSDFHSRSLSRESMQSEKSGTLSAS